MKKKKEENQRARFLVVCLWKQTNKKSCWQKRQKCATALSELREAHKNEAEEPMSALALAASEGGRD